jgi:hypothetical protein
MSSCFHTFSPAELAFKGTHEKVISKASWWRAKESIGAIIRKREQAVNTRLPWISKLPLQAREGIHGSTAPPEKLRGLPSRRTSVK